MSGSLGVKWLDILTATLCSFRRRVTRAVTDIHGAGTFGPRFIKDSCWPLKNISLGPLFGRRSLSTV